MDTPQRRLELFIKKIFGTKKEFTDWLNVEQSWATKYTGNGKSIVQSKKILDKLEQKGLNINWYLEGHGEMLLKKNETNAAILDVTMSPDELTREIPFITVRANAGEGFSFSDLEVAYLREPFTKYNETCKKLRITGDSMLPIKSGSIITFDEAIIPASGDMVVAIVDGVLYFKIFEIKNNHKYLTSSNKEYEDIPLNGFGDWKILGKVIAITEK